MRDEVYTHFPEEFKAFQYREDEWVDITYPILESLDKINSKSLDKEEQLGGRLIGVKAQYLIFENGVFQTRKHAGYQVEVKATHSV